MGVLTFSFSMGVTGLPQQMTEFVSDLHLAPVVVLCVILLIYLALGAIMDSNTVMFVTIPIVTPLVTGMGYDLVWWGIINLSGAGDRIDHTAVRPAPVRAQEHRRRRRAAGHGLSGVMPFVCADLIKLALLVLFPALALWLPSTMRG